MIPNTDNGSKPADADHGHNRALRAKARGRNRITGNRSVRSRPLAPSQPPPRIAIASDVPPRGRKFGDLHAQGVVQSIGHTVVPESGRAYISLPIATQAAAYRIVSTQNAARKVLSSMTANHGKGARASM